MEMCEPMGQYGIVCKVNMYISHMKKVMKGCKLCLGGPSAKPKVEKGNKTTGVDSPKGILLYS